MIFERDCYRQILKDELFRRTANNPSYSQRAFARSLNLAPGELSEIMRSKRPLSIKKAIKISKALGLNSQEAKHVMYLVQVEQGQDLEYQEVSHKQEKTISKKSLETDVFDVVSEWYCFAILNLLECEEFIWSNTWIARRLGISILQAKEAVEKLERVGLLKKVDSGYKAIDEFVATGKEIPSRAIRNYHRQILTKAIEALELQDVKNRDISGLGIAVSKRDISAIKREIADFKEMLVEKYSKGAKDRVYHLETAFFEITKGSEL